MGWETRRRKSPQLPESIKGYDFLLRHSTNSRKTTTIWIDTNVAIADNNSYQDSGIDQRGDSALACNSRAVALTGSPEAAAETSEVSFMFTPESVLSTRIAHSQQDSSLFLKGQRCCQTSPLSTRAFARCC